MLNVTYLGSTLNLEQEKVMISEADVSAILTRTTYEEGFEDKDILFMLPMWMALAHFHYCYKVYASKVKYIGIGLLILRIIAWGSIAWKYFN